jgi:hypothetical protein
MMKGAITGWEWNPSWGAQPYDEQIRAFRFHEFGQMTCPACGSVECDQSNNCPEMANAYREQQRRYHDHRFG